MKVCYTSHLNAPVFCTFYSLQFYIIEFS